MELPSHCRTCLCSDRKLFPISAYIETCKNLFRDCNLILAIEDVSVCWECLAVVRKVAEFIDRVQVSQSLLQAALQETITLPSLKCSSRLGYSGVTVYDNSSFSDVAPCVAVKEEPETKDHSFDEPMDEYTIDVKATELLADMKQEDEAIDDNVLNSTTELLAKTSKDRTYNYKLIEGVNYTNNYKRVKIDDDELKFWLQMDREYHLYVRSQFKCAKCIVGFRNKANYVKHKKNYHYKLNTFVCKICEIRLQTDVSLERHSRQHYFKYTCDLCTYQCHRPTMMYDHFRREHSRKFACLKCGFSFNNTHTFFKHYREMHRKFICDYCGKVCSKKSIIRLHISRHHSKYRCDTCDKTFKNHNTYVSHCNLKHTKATTEAAYCVECDIQFDNVGLFKRHVQYSVKHRGQRKPEPEINPVQCLMCDKIYSRKTFMMNHYRYVHLKKTKHYCQPCDKYFLNATRVKEHKLYYHEHQPKSLNKCCHICGRGFSNTRSLNNHVRTHTGERPYACSHCPAKFAQKYAMQKHVKTIHFKAKRTLSEYVKSYHVINEDSLT